MMQAATLRPAAAHRPALRLPTGHWKVPTNRNRMGARKFSRTGPLCLEASAGDRQHQVICLNMWFIICILLILLFRFHTALSLHLSHLCSYYINTMALYSLHGTSPARSTGRQCRHSSVLKLRCSAATHPQHNFNVDQFEAVGLEVTKKLRAFYWFCRPHTIIGTILGITSVSLLPMKSLDDLSVTVLWRFLEALASALCMNIYVVGLNQLFDIEIDKVNKPNLPLASGEFSVVTGVFLVVASVVTSISIGVRSKSAPLMCALLVSFLLGSAYSIDVPLLRWKRHPVLAAFCILVVRAILVQLAFFTHMQQHILKRPFVPTRSVVFATLFMCCFSAVIALFKDIPDVDGDRDFGIQSLSVQLGQHRVYRLCINILMAAYTVAILIGASSANLYQKIATVFGHGLLAFMLWQRAQQFDVADMASITPFYMFIWKLFYAEYFLIPFV